MREISSLLVSPNYRKKENKYSMVKLMSKTVKRDSEELPLKLTDIIAAQSKPAKDLMALKDLLISI